jgi:hypothetical protein
MKNSTWNKGVKVFEAIVILIAFFALYFGTSLFIYVLEK